MQGKVHKFSRFNPRGCSQKLKRKDSWLSLIILKMKPMNKKSNVLISHHLPFLSFLIVGWCWWPFLFQYWDYIPTKVLTLEGLANTVTYG